METVSETPVRKGRKPKTAGSKRKRELADGGDGTLQINKDASRKKQSRSNGDVKLVLDEQPAAQNRPKSKGNLNIEVDEKLATMNPSLLADYLAQKIRFRYRKLESAQIESKYISSQVFFDTSSYDQQRNLDNLPSFLRAFATNGDRLSFAYSESSCPHTLVVAASGLRAADLTRSLREFQSKDAAVAKLFAKHIKISEAIEYVKRSQMGIGVGTPQRLVDLLEKDVLKTTDLKNIVIDASYIDQKKRSIFDMTELLEPVLQLLSMPSIQSNLGGGGGGSGSDEAIRVLAF